MKLLCHANVNRDDDTGTTRTMWKELAERGFKSLQILPTLSSFPLVSSHISLSRENYSKNKLEDYTAWRSFHTTSFVYRTIEQERLLYVRRNSQVIVNYNTLFPSSFGCLEIFPIFIFSCRRKSLWFWRHKMTMTGWPPNRISKSSIDSRSFNFKKFIYLQ